ncbi:MAG: RrF2 family transcriptional regulator [Planctomycetota bacterium]|jgi:Rrf2 family protein
MLGPHRLSQKCRYALRALFELSLRGENSPVKARDIASAQAIPLRFLEVILAELKNAGFVESKRGNGGGYILARSPSNLTVGEVISFVQGGLTKRIPDEGDGAAITGDYVFSRMWRRVSTLISDVYDQTTFADLVQEELDRRRPFVLNYAI